MTENEVTEAMLEKGSKMYNLNLPKTTLIVLYQAR
jgi:hypothetical protein